jgi:hypothetical protein
MPMTDEELADRVAQLRAANDAQDLQAEIVVHTYTGPTPEVTAEAFEADARRLAASGLYPVSQSWASGRPGLMRILTMGLYSLAARQPDTLTVTYERRHRARRR